MFKKIMAMSLAAAMSVLCCACQSQSESTDTSNDVSTFDASGNTSIDTSFIHDENLKLNSYKAEKLGEFKLPSDLDAIDYDAVDGLVYSKNGKYGIMSNDGKHDTGLVYGYCEPAIDSRYFIVAKNYNLDSKNVDTLNVFGLVDGNGNAILDEKYAVIDMHNDAFAVAYTVTSGEPYADEDDAKCVAWYHQADKFVSTIIGRAGDISYKGKAEVYSLNAHAFLNALTVKTNQEASGLSFNQAYVCNSAGTYNYKGEKISKYNQGVSGFNRCSYCRIEDNDAVRILDKEGNTVMRIGGNGKYNAYDMMYCSVRTSDDNKEYVSICNHDTGKYDLVDLHTMTVVMQTDDAVHEIKGNIVATNEDDFYNLRTGEKLTLPSGGFRLYKHDAVLDNGCLLTNDDEKMYVDNDCNMIVKTSKDNDSIDITSFVPHTQYGEDLYAYSYGDKKFILGKSFEFENFLIECEDYLMDATSGKKLMSGYNVYRVTEGDNYLIVTCVGNNDSYVRYKLTKDTKDA